MRTGTQVVCNRPSQSGNHLVDGVLQSVTDRGYWVLVGQVEFYFPKWAVREDRATISRPARIQFVGRQDFQGERFGDA